MRDGNAIVEKLGGRREGRQWRFCCPIHHGMGCTMRDDGLITCWSKGCFRSEIHAALDALGLKDDGKRKVIDREAEHADREHCIKIAQKMWNDALPGKDSCEHYLKRRGIILPVPPVIRRYNLNGIIYCVQKLDGNITAVQWKMHREKRTHGVMAGTGAAVQLAPPRDGELGIAEGVETALSATQLTGIPCWATLGTAWLDKVELPDTVNMVHLFVDNDDEGKEAAQRAVKRYCYRSGLMVYEHWPPAEFNDWNDVLTNKPTVE